MNKTYKQGFLMVFLVMVFSPAVHALGLGDLTIYSRLNQKLEAEIELVASTSDDLAGVKAQLAAKEMFKREGLPYVHALVSDMRFSVSVKPSGQAVIRVTSKSPVREPIIRFMVDVAWDKGHVLRGYEAAINPP